MLEEAAQWGDANAGGTAEFCHSVPDYRFISMVWDFFYCLESKLLEKFTHINGIIPVLKEKGCVCNGIYDWKADPA
jgi:hypothetical protein